MRFPWLQKVKFRHKLNPWSPKELWNSRFEKELPCLKFFTSLHVFNTFHGDMTTNIRGFIFCTWYSLFLLLLYVCYFYFTKLAKLIHFLSSWVRFHRFQFFSVYMNQLLSFFMYHYIVKSSKEYLTCNLQLQGADFPASPFAPFIPASPLLPLSPFPP